MNDDPASARVADNGNGDIFSDEEWAQVLETLGLTPQQRRIVGLLLEGEGDKEIARKLGIAFSTLRTHINRIFEHLGVHDRAGIVRQLFAEFRRGCGDCPRRHRRPRQ